MNFEEALVLLKDGKKVRRIREESDYEDVIIWFDKYHHIVEGDGTISDSTYILKLEDVFATNWEEYKEPLLTEEEKEYLRMIIKFSPGNIKLVTLGRYFGDCNYIYLWHSLDDRDNSNSHCVNKKFFKNLEGYRCYTLEELDLDET